MMAARGTANPRPQQVWLRTLLCVCCLLAGGAAVVAQPSLSEPPISIDDRDHWSFRPLQRPPRAPATPGQSPRQPIDRWLASAWSERGLTSAGTADRATLLRRLSFDVRGLPPRPGEITRWNADTSPDAYERLVDRLLSDPQSGEHTAQHWLDLARFADTDGFEFDKAREEAWKFRDWVIDALNADMPYDRFIALQLAGDELAPGDKGAQIATTFCLSGPDMPDINSQQERLHNVLNELTGTVGSVLLALQIGCAQCHDHKYDPISQADFYRLRAVFEPAVRVKRNQSLSVLSEQGDPPVSHLMIRGDWRRQGPAVTAAAPRIANPSAAPLTARPADGSSGRRTALAHWLTTPSNPLTARVIANRLWQFHFGEGLCRTPSDFGTIGEEPSHPALLDWLAVELPHQGWSLKQLHRLLITSTTYRQRTQATDNGQRDPDNVWLARFPRRRLSGEALRDAMLSVSGSLSAARGGPGVMPPLPPELLKTLLKNQWNVTTRQADHYRRSIYLFARRNLRYPMFEAFDRPDGNASCPRRSQSTTAPQSLLLLNSRFALDAAKRLAGALLAERSTVDQATYRDLFWRVLCRPPTATEQHLLATFYGRQRTLLSTQRRSRESLALPLPCPVDIDPIDAAALTDVCLAVFNTSEFLYID